MGRKHESGFVSRLLAESPVLMDQTRVKQGRVCNKHMDGCADHSSAAKARGGVTACVPERGSPWSPVQCWRVSPGAEVLWSLVNRAQRNCDQELATWLVSASPSKPLGGLWEAGLVQSRFSVKVMDPGSGQGASLTPWPQRHGHPGLEAWAHHRSPAPRTGWG